MWRAQREIKLWGGTVTMKKSPGELDVLPVFSWRSFLESVVYILREYIPLIMIWLHFNQCIPCKRAGEGYHMVFVVYVSTNSVQSFCPWVLDVSVYLKCFLLGCAMLTSSTEYSCKTSVIIGDHSERAAGVYLWTNCTLVSGARFIRMEESPNMESMLSSCCGVYNASYFGGGELSNDDVTLNIPQAAIVYKELLG